MNRSDRQARSVARLAAAQALYQMETSGGGVETAIRGFTEHGLGEEIEGVRLADLDEDFFRELVRGVVTEQAEIDRRLVSHLAKGWRLERLDATVRAILRCGAFEVLHRADVPTEVAIDEYVELAKSFFGGPEPGFVNAALDAIAKDERAA